jgi:NAD(P)-dependent dehydrogenase (short-subunit alcohol dehydrogenase family)
MNLLDGKVAIVTGAAQGIGATYAEHLASLGAGVIVADVNDTKAKETAQSIAAGGARARAVVVDISDPTSCEALAADVVEQDGRIDILVNNAALYSGLELMPAEEIPLDVWRRYVDVNLSGNYYMCRAVIPVMKGQQSGKIVNQSSIGTWLHAANTLHYTLTKAAMISLTQVLASELGESGINVNAIAPGVIATAATMERARPQSGDVLNIAQIKRMGTPDDLRGALEFLCSPASDYMTGQVLVVDGGICMRS